jgi:hypothetical protein
MKEEKANGHDTHIPFVFALRIFSKREYCW